MTARRSTRARARTTIPRVSAQSQGTIFQIGEVLADTYEIREVLGSGGMGQVFDAHDRALNRRVALKAHWPHMHEFPIRKEAQALAAIRDPAVVTVHSAGRHRDVEFIVMERILGVTLADHIERREARVPFPLVDAIDILARLADGLAAVHAAGIAHRDVKPANIMLAPRNRLVLTDFGIFHAEFEGSALAAGTAEYMAPEAIESRVARGGAYLVDIYAFGVVAFELLTGERPFNASSVEHVLQRQLHHEPPPLASLRPDVPARVAALLDSTLRKDPEDRPASMETVASMLRSVATTPTTRAISVLIGEDDSALADVLEDFVAEVAPDANVRVARDGGAVLAHIRQSPPDLLLLDVGLPTMNGIELCMHLRGEQLARDTRIVALSAAAQPKDVALLRQLGIQTFIRKGNDWLDRIEDAIQETRVSVPPRAQVAR